MWAYRTLSLDRLDQEILEILKIIDRPVWDQANVLLELIREKTVPIPKEKKDRCFQETLIEGVNVAGDP